MESAVLALKKIYLRPHGMLVGDLGDILVAPESLRRELSHYICEDQLERVLNVLVGCLGMSPLTAFPHGANVTVWHGSVEAYSVVIHLLQEVQTFSVEAPHPPMPEGGGSRRLHYELWRAAPTDKVQQKKVQVVLKLLERKREVVYLQPWIVFVEDGNDVVARCLLNREEVTP